MAQKIAPIVMAPDYSDDSLSGSFDDLNLSGSISPTSLIIPIRPISPLRPTVISPIAPITTTRQVVVPQPAITTTRQIVIPQPAITTTRQVVVPQPTITTKPAVGQQIIVPTTKVRRTRVVSPKEVQVLVTGPVLTLTSFTNKNLFLRGTTNPGEPGKYMTTLRQLTNSKISARTSKQLGKGWAIPMADYQAVGTFVQQVNAGQLPVTTPQVALGAPAAGPSPIPSPRGNFIGNVAFSDGYLLMGGAGELYDMIGIYTSRDQLVQALQAVQVPESQRGHLLTKENVLVLSNFGDRQDTNVYVEKDAAGLDAQITLN